MKTQDNFISRVHRNTRQRASQLASAEKTLPIYKVTLQLSLAFRLVKRGAKAIKSSSSEIVVASFVILKPQVPKFSSQGMFHLFLSIWLVGYHYCKWRSLSSFNTKPSVMEQTFCSQFNHRAVLLPVLCWDTLNYLFEIKKKVFISGSRIINH